LPRVARIRRGCGAAAPQPGPMARTGRTQHGLSSAGRRRSPAPGAGPMGRGGGAGIARGPGAGACGAGCECPRRPARGRAGAAFQNGPNERLKPGPSRYPGKTPGRRACRMRRCRPGTRLSRRQHVRSPGPRGTPAGTWFCALFWRKCIGVFGCCGEAGRKLRSRAAAFFGKCIDRALPRFLDTESMHLRQTSTGFNHPPAAPPPHRCRAFVIRRFSRLKRRITNARHRRVANAWHLTKTGSGHIRPEPVCHT